MQNANKAQQLVMASQEAQIQAHQEVDDIDDIVRNIHEYAPDLQLDDGYIEHVVAGFRNARCKYEAATAEQQNATAQLLTAQVATLEVMGETHALSEPNAHSNFGKVKNNPCILCKQRYTTEEILHNHILKEHGEMLDAFVSINSTFFHFKFECFFGCSKCYVQKCNMHVLQVMGEIGNILQVKEQEEWKHVEGGGKQKKKSVSSIKMSVTVIY